MPFDPVQSTDPPARVLVAEDEADMRALLDSILSPQFAVVLVADGNAALAAVRQQRFDLVLADITMPGLDGLGLLRELRADPSTASVPVILLSGGAAEAARVAGLTAGADDYVTKPFSSRELVARVSIHVQSTRLRLQAEAASVRLAAALTREQAARAEAERASRAKDEFLAMLGHELRNPLAPILTACELLRMRDESSARELDVIERHTQHLVRLVDDLLDVARVARGKFEVKKAPVDLAAVVAKAVEFASPLLESRHHHFSVAVDQAIRLHADEARLTQVLANLLTNAAKYTDPGGRITLRAQREADSVVIQVEDNGKGISADLLPRVFDLFIQAPRTSARSEGGLGIGLSLVRNLVAMHGGTVSAHSDGLNRGSRFEVRLPALPAGAVASAPSTAEPAAASERARRILVVDDNHDAAELLAQVLGRHGHHVTVAHDGQQALDAAERWEPEVAIVDLGLPVLDGFQVAARLRQRFGQRMRLIAVSGYGQEGDRNRSQAAGFSAHLTKPVVSADLLALMDDGHN